MIYIKSVMCFLFPIRSNQCYLEFCWLKWLLWLFLSLYLLAAENLGRDTVQTKEKVNGKDILDGGTKKDKMFLKYFL